VELKTPHKDWLGDRRIDPVLAEKFGLHTVQMEGRNWLAVPYVEHGRTVNHKYRVTSEKSAETLVEVLDTAKPYPVRGLYAIDDFPEQPAYTAYPSGIPELDALFQVVLRTFTVVTGFAGQGKTSFLMWLIAGLIRRGVHVTVASFETDIKPIFLRKLRAAILGAAEYTRHDPKEQAWADDMIRRHLAIISHAPQADEDSLSIEDVLDLGRASVIRNGTRVLIIDPWNEVDHKRPRDESETDYTGRAIRMIKRFAKQNDVAAWEIGRAS
jgi:twinkle protein